jgi:hypothetical protein
MQAGSIINTQGRLETALQKGVESCKLRKYQCCTVVNISGGVVRHALEGSAVR